MTSTSNKRTAEQSAATDTTNASLSSLSSAPPPPTSASVQPASLRASGGAIAPAADNDNDNDNDNHEYDKDNDDEASVSARAGAAKARRAEVTCPYLTQIHREVLDFDFEKVCSVSLSPLNVYACLSCGKYFEGRGRKSHAYFHSLQADHHVFIHLQNKHVFCLPDDYEVLDESLSDVKHVLDPHFAPAEIANIDALAAQHSRGLDNVEYIPGLVGLNNIKNNDYLNVILQALAHVPTLRDFFLDESNYASSRSVLVHCFGELMRKLWNLRNFKGHVSPHQMLQAVSSRSERHFHIGNKYDPLEFLSWLLNTLHTDLGGTRKPGSSIIHTAFQGRIEMTRITQEKQARPMPDGETARPVPIVVEKEETSEVPSLYLSLDIPPPPLFVNAMETNVIPQVPLVELMTKFDGVTWQLLPNGERRRYSIRQLPRYLIVHLKRFTKNNFFTEKNPTIVNFPVKHFEMREYLRADAAAADANVNTKYDLVASVRHQGAADSGSWSVHTSERATDKWYELQDLFIEPVLPALIPLSEAYILFYERSSA